MLNIQTDQTWNNMNSPSSPPLGDNVYHHQCCFMPAAVSCESQLGEETTCRCEEILHVSVVSERADLTGSRARFKSSATQEDYGKCLRTP